MFKHFKNFLKEEDGIGVVEIVLILAIIVGIALIFKDKITEFVGNLLNSITGEETQNQFNPQTIQEGANQN